MLGAGAAAAHTPSILALTRQAVPLAAHRGGRARTGRAKGAYVLARGRRRQARRHHPGHRLGGRRRHGRARSSLPRTASRQPWCRCRAGNCSRRSLLPIARRCWVRRRGSASKPAVGFGWERWLGDVGVFVGMEGFGASAPAAKLYEHFGITPSKVAEAAKHLAAALMDLDKLKTTAGLDVKGKRVLVRADLNVPVQGRQGQRRHAARALRARACGTWPSAAPSVIVISHFGRPKGGPDPQFSLKPVADKLGQLLRRPVAFADDCVGEPARSVPWRRCSPASIAVLENLRFHKGEEKNDPEFAAAPGDARRHLRQRCFLRGASRARLHRCRSRACCRPTPAR